MSFSDARSAWGWSVATTRLRGAVGTRFAATDRLDENVLGEKASALDRRFASCRRPRSGCMARGTGKSTAPGDPAEAASLKTPADAQVWATEAPLGGNRQPHAAGDVRGPKPARGMAQCGADVQGRSFVPAAYDRVLSDARGWRTLGFSGAGAAECFHGDSNSPVAGRPSRRLDRGHRRSPSRDADPVAYSVEPAQSARLTPDRRASSRVQSHALTTRVDRRPLAAPCGTPQLSRVALCAAQRNFAAMGADAITIIGHRAVSLGGCRE